VAVVPGGRRSTRRSTGRLTLYLAATGENVGPARVRRDPRLQPGAGRRNRHPDAWHSRLPATLEVTSNWAALAQLGAPASLVADAMRLDRQRIDGEDGLCWTPQFRDIESLRRMTERVGERAALAFFVSNLHEQVQAGRSRMPRRPPHAATSVFAGRLR
jgi:hypothetical protein